MKLAAYEVIALMITLAFIATPSLGYLNKSQELETPSTNNKCILSTGSLGQCVDISNCSIILNELKAEKVDPKIIKYVKDSNLICGQIGHNVCCPKDNSLVEPIPRRLPTEEEKCGKQRNVTFKKLIGGGKAKKGAWPWIALLAYDYGSSYQFKCGGSLITARHILTAAHCILNELKFVRLGEHDLSTEKEAQHVDINVVKKEVHPHYNRLTRRADLAIIYLERNVEFSEVIVPICLPNTPSLRAKSHVDLNPIIIGWRKTHGECQSENIIHQVQVTVWENEVCQSSYGKLNQNFTEDQFDGAVLCAGDVLGGWEACLADSGGPLMAPELNGTTFKYYLIGVVAYGCGCDALSAPAVYTSTQYFIDWIIEKVQDTP